MDPITTVDGLVARPQGLELRADDVTVTTLPYMSSPEEAIAVLTEVFGTPPVEEPYDGGNHRPDGVHHHWDPFVLDERFYDEGRRESENLDWVVWPRFAVYFDGPAVGPIVLSAANGLQAGDAWSEAEADESFDDDVWTCVGTSIEAEAIEVPADRPDRVNVVVSPSDDGRSVKWIGAPEMEADGCA
ncbi:hypothetical protein PX701_14410 [Agromyces sp. H3Y2-19a]|uniref:hypothetical protein n=1 Tax=Agromyces chromiiresistens TaxID=3030835 RepID=UPI0023B91CCA|nr:hypothetical protein [Agromyces chromiiresistens]MDF0514821.1 hypothetical protein [Agromyces chromiiresistens]